MSTFRPRMWVHAHCSIRELPCIHNFTFTFFYEHAIHVQAPLHLVLKQGKCATPPLPAMPWYSASCPPHLSNFRDTVAAASAEAAASSNAVMHQSSAAMGCLPPTFMKVGEEHSYFDHSHLSYKFHSTIVCSHAHPPKVRREEVTTIRSAAAVCGPLRLVQMSANICFKEG